MSVQAAVYYHRIDLMSQVYHIDAGGIPGNIISPEHDVVSVQVNDIRQGEVAINFRDDSVMFKASPSAVSEFVHSTQWCDQDDTEISTLLKDKLAAQDVIVFDHTVRIDDPNAERKPARNLHSDDSLAGAKRRLIDLLGEEKAKEWSQGHFGFISVNDWFSGSH